MWELTFFFFFYLFLLILYFFSFEFIFLFIDNEECKQVTQVRWLKIIWLWIIWHIECCLRDKGFNISIQIRKGTCHRDIGNDTFECMWTNVMHIRRRIPYFIVFIDNHSSDGWSIWWNMESEKLKCRKNSDQK